MKTLFRTLVLLSVAIASPAAISQPVTFKKIADTSTSIPPSNTGNFGEFFSPSLDAGSVVFAARSADFLEQGVYVGDGTALDVIADLNTMRPGGSGNFSSFTFRVPDISGNDIVFRSGGGVYLDDGVSLSVVADTNTPQPGGSRNFSGFSDSVVDDGAIGFNADDVSDFQGVYFFDNSLLKLSDANTAVPVRGGSFSFFDGPCLDGLKVAFVGWFGGSLGTGHGVYSQEVGSLPIRVADTSTAIPGGIGNFSGLGFAQIQNFGGRRCSTPVSGNRVVLEGRGTGQNGIYVHDGTTLDVVADLNTPIPEGVGTFTEFIGPAISGESVAFLALGSEGQQGIYGSSGGMLEKIVDLSDSLDGKTLSGLDLSPHGFDGEQIAFRGTFTDGSSGIFLVPEPPSSAMLVTGIGFLIALARKR